MSGILPAPLPDASATVRGAVSTGTQTFAGGKSFLAKVTLPDTGLTLGAGGDISYSGGNITIGSGNVTAPSYFRGLGSSTAFYAANSGRFASNAAWVGRSETLGALGTDIIATLGTFVADASIHTSAKLLSLRTGLGTGTEVEHISFKPLGSIVGYGGVATATLNSTYGGRMDYGVNMIGATPTGARLIAGSGGGDVEAYSGLGASGTDNAVKVGTSLAYASVNGNAHVLSVRSGIGGTETESMYITSQSVIGSSRAIFRAESTGGTFGGAYMSLQNESGANGPIFGTTGGLELTDFGIKTTSGAQKNIRFENRGGEQELQFGTPGYGELQLRANYIWLRPGLAAGLGTAVALGTSTADTSVATNAKLLSIQTGIGGNPVEKAYFGSDGSLTLSSGITLTDLATPTADTHTTASTGGTMAPGTYYYRISALNAWGETLASTESSIVVPAGTNTNTVTVKWLAVSKATSYKVYGRSTGAELYMATVTAPTLLWLDTGSVTPAGALPTYNTTSGIFSAATNKMYSSLGAASGDVAVKVGTSVANASVNIGARLLSVRAGIGSTETEVLYVTKGTNGGYQILTSTSSGQISVDNSVGTQIGWNSASWATFDSVQGALYGATNSRIQGGVANGATAVANIINTGNTLSTAGAKILSIQNHGTEKVYFDLNGTLNINQPGINIPAINLPSGAGGYGYGGSINFGAVFNNIGFTGPTTGGGSGLYVQSAGANTPLTLMSANDSVLVAGWNTGSPGATDILTKIGTKVADGSVNAGAKLAAFSTGISGTEVESIYVKKGGIIGGGGQIITMNDTVGTKIISGPATFQVLFAAGLSSITADAQSIYLKSSLGSGATDVGNIIGFSTADGSVDAAAKLVSFQTGIGLTTSEKAYIDKSGNLSTAVNLTTAQTVSGGKAGAVTALTSSGASIAINLATNINFSHTMTENTTLAAPSNPVAGQSGVITITQHASAPKTLAYNSFWKFSGGTVPTLTATNSAIDVFTYYVISGSMAVCTLIKGIA